MKTFPALYKKTSTGATQIWYQEIEGSKYRTVSGQIHGKKVVSAWTQAKTTNEGRANERSPEQQAEFEVAATYKKKLEKDYHESINDTAKGSKIYEPMTAEKYKDAIISKNHKPDYKNLYIQPKLDGMRCIIKKDGMWSRKGKTIVSAPHIFDELKPLFDKDPELVLDGELYNHKFKFDFNELISIFRQTKPKAHDLEKSKELGEFHCYDIPSKGNLNFGERHEYLAKLLTSKKFKMIVLVETHHCTSEKELDNWYDKFQDEGYEGGMVRFDAPYEHDRTWSLLKRKETMDAEFTLDRLESGEGNWSGKARIAWLKLKDGREFKADICGTMAFCEQVMKNEKKYKGKKTTVVFQDYTPDGIPRFGKCKEFNRIDI